MVDVGAPAKMRVLVVDDSSLVRLYYRSALEKAGFEVEQAINGIEAMERVLSQPFDLVIVDVNMPRMDGLTFLRALRCGAADVATLPALMISTESEAQDVAAARAAGANFYLIKPVARSRIGSACLRPHGRRVVSALQEQFVNEARELIRQATDDLIALERDGASPERVDRVFRAFHTLKGAAGVVELPAMSVMLHAAEDLLARVRQGALGSGPDIIDAALACLDQVSRWVDDFEAVGALPAQAGEDGRVLAERLRTFLPAEAGEPARADRKSEAGREPGVPGWAARMITAERDAMASQMPKHALFLSAVSYQPIAGCFYNGDDPLQLMRQLPDLLAVHVEPREAFAPLADIDPYACNLRLQAVSAGDPDEIARIFRLVPDQVHITSIPLNELSLAPSVSNDADQSLIRTIIEAQCELLRVSDRTEDFAGCTGAASQVVTNALRCAGRPQLAETVQRAGAAALTQRDAGPLLTALEQALVELDDAPSTAVAPDINGPGAMAAGITERPPERVLRVSEAKIEALVNLAGELVVAKNTLAHSAKRVEQEFGSQEVAGLIRRDHDAIDRLVVELHGTILGLRMVPVAQVFGSFPRLVRDVSRQLGKNVALVTRGESAEADKTIVDRLFEPLVHLVRNAVDHGVESPDHRRAAGKPETATISIEASQTGDRFVHRGQR